MHFLVFISPSFADKFLGGTNAGFIGLAKSNFFDLIKSLLLNRKNTAYEAIHWYVNHLMPCPHRNLYSG